MVVPLWQIGRSQQLLSCKKEENNQDSDGARGIVLALCAGIETTTFP